MRMEREKEKEKERERERKKERKREKREIDVTMGTKSIRGYIKVGTERVNVVIVTLKINQIIRIITYENTSCFYHRTEETLETKS